MNPIRRTIASAVTAAHVSSLALFGALGVTPAAHAVVQDIRIVNEAGEPLPGQTVTITFPSGKVETVTDGEDDDDDDGIIWFDFPEDGTYTVTWPGGSATVEVVDGEPSSSNRNILIVGGLFLTAIAVVVASNDDDSSSEPPPVAEAPVAEDEDQEEAEDEEPAEEETPPEDDAPAEEEEPAEEEPEGEETEEPSEEEEPGGPVDEEEEGGGGEDDDDEEFAGSYRGRTPDIIVTTNPDEHPTSAIEDALYVIIISPDGTIEIRIQNQPDGVDAVIFGNYDPVTGEFEAIGFGTYFGFPDTEFELRGNIFELGTGSDSSWEGWGAIGNNGSLPDSNNNGIPEGWEFTFIGPIEPEG